MAPMPPPHGQSGSAHVASGQRAPILKGQGTMCGENSATALKTVIWGDSRQKTRF